MLPSVFKILFKSDQLYGCYCKVFRVFTFWGTHCSWLHYQWRNSDHAVELFGNGIAQVLITLSVLAVIGLYDGTIWQCNRWNIRMKVTFSVRYRHPSYDGHLYLSCIHRSCVWTVWQLLRPLMNSCFYLSHQLHRKTRNVHCHPVIGATVILWYSIKCVSILTILSFFCIQRSSAEMLESWALNLLVLPHYHADD